MTTSFDIILDCGHPQFREIQTWMAGGDGSLSQVDADGWHTALAVGQAEWVVILDRRLNISAADCQTLAQGLDAARGQLCLHSVSTSNPILRSVFENCSPRIGLLWDCRVCHQALCVRRSALSSLPAILDAHPDPLWKWLIDVADTLETASPTIPSDVPIEKTWPHTSEMPNLSARQPRAELNWLIEHIERIRPRQLVPDLKSEADAVAVKSGLLQWHDATEASHQLSQSIEGLGKHQSGDYWHAIHHRREPDYSNAKYWFHQFKHHSVFAELPPAATQILAGLPAAEAWLNRLLGKGKWDPFAFVDLCEACAGQEESPLGLAARRIQAVEMQLLMAATYRDAMGK